MTPVLSLRDLDSWSFSGTALAVLGHPVGHSLSPQMHNAALAGLARSDRSFASWKYFAIDVPPADLPGALQKLNAARFHGLNLTVPHKVSAMQLVGEIEPQARAIGAVNTLIRTPAGWRGNNTDGHGLTEAVREALGFNFAGAPVILLGAGGAARGAAVECLRRECSSLAIANRTRANLDTLITELAPVAGKTPLQGFDPAAPPASLPAGAIVINATRLGLVPGDPAPIELASLPRPACVFDMIYNPPETALLKQARALRIPCANGLAMLVHQGAKALEIWTGFPSTRIAPLMRTAVSGPAQASSHAS